MKRHRLYFPDPIPAHGECVLPAAQAHHTVRVLRLGVGDSLTLFDGRGTEYPAAIMGSDRHGMTVRLTGERAVDRESPLQVTLVQGVSSGERMDYTVQKAVELGIAHIQPVTSQRSVVRLKDARAEKRVAHWQLVAIAACEQCGRNVLPEVAPVLDFRDWLATLPAAAGAAAGGRLILDPEGELRMAEMPAPSGPLMLLAGPEGGFDETEIAMARSLGFAGLRLGPRVLRTETAALAALAALQARWGDF